MQGGLLQFGKLISLEHTETLPNIDLLFKIVEL